MIKLSMKIEQPKNIKIVVHSEGCEPVKNENGDWIDLKTARDYTLYPGEEKMLSLGVSMKLPDGYEAIIAPRSSTYKRYKIVMTNSIGIIDNSYSGTNDVWMFPAKYYGSEVYTIPKGTRIAQFRIQQKQSDINFIFADKLDEVDRGGFGSTGV